MAVLDKFWKEIIFFYFFLIFIFFYLIWHLRQINEKN